MTVKQLQDVRELELISYYISLNNHIIYEYRLAQRYRRAGSVEAHQTMMKQVSVRNHLMYLILMEMYDRRKN